MGSLVQDVRYGIRQLFRQRGSSAVAVLTLALGIGLSTALFSVIDTTMLRPLPYPHPEQLVTIGPEELQANGQPGLLAPSMEDMRTWQQAQDVLSSVAGRGSAFGGRIFDGSEPERIQVTHFTEDYLAMHGVAPLIGRGFVREDCDPGSPLVALLGYGYWQSHFGGQKDVIGKTLRLDTDLATIVGVLPGWFDATTPVVIPLRVPATEFERRGTGRLSVYARLRPGVTIEQATARLSAITPGARRANGTIGQARARVTSRLETAIKSYRTTVNVFVAAVALILLLAGVNVAGLLLARGAARQSEAAIRASLGASRGRLLRQLLTESVVLAVPGGALGIFLAWLSLDTLVANIPLSLPSNSPVTLNGTVLVATLALLLPTALLAGLAPAIRLSRVRFGATLARGGRQTGSSLSQRGGQVLIALEVALAVVLLAGAGLMIRSFVRISTADLGFKPDGLVTMQVSPLNTPGAARKEYYTALLRRIRAIPGVSSAGLVDYFPLTDTTSFTSVKVAGRRSGTTAFRYMPGYFEALGARLKQGRWPTDADYASSFHGVIVTESAAKLFFPDGGSPIGRELSKFDGTAFTILGVIGDLRHGGPLDERSRHQPEVFFPYEPTEGMSNEAMMIVVRASGARRGFADQLRQAAQSIGPRVLIEKVRTGNDWFGDRVITPRRRTVLLGLLGGLGLALALVGVFGMTAYAVGRRTREIGVRLAFGARPGQVVGTMMRDAAMPIAAGTVLGIAIAALTTRVMESFLFETSPVDPLTLALVAAALAAAGCLAALAPALRAAQVDPASSLRAD